MDYKASVWVGKAFSWGIYDGCGDRSGFYHPGWRGHSHSWVVDDEMAVAYPLPVQRSPQ